MDIPTSVADAVLKRIIKIDPTFNFADFEFDSRNRSMTERLLSLFTHFHKVTGSPAWGVDLGRRVNLLSFGFFGYAVVSAPTWMHGLQMLTRYGPLVGSIFDYTLDIDDAEVAVTLTPRVNLGSLEQGIVEFALSNIYRQGYAVSFGEARRFHYSFKYAKPPYFELLLQSLGGSMAFDQPEYKMVVPREFCEAESPLFNEEIWRLSIQQCRKEYSITTYLSDHSEIPELVSHYIESALISNSNVEGICNPLPGIDDVAKMIGISESYLRKQLKRYGSSFRSIKEKARRNAALELLSNHQRSIDSISQILGYTSPANFTRACHQWYGETPKAIRSNIDRFR